MNEAGGALKVYTISVNVIIEPVPNLTGLDVVLMSAKLREINKINLTAEQ